MLFVSCFGFFLVTTADFLFFGCSFSKMAPRLHASPQAWMFVEELDSPLEGGVDWSGRLLLQQLGATELLPEDKQRLRDLVVQVGNSGKVLLG